MSAAGVAYAERFREERIAADLLRVYGEARAGAVTGERALASGQR
jgi:hypothetical protein